MEIICTAVISAAVLLLLTLPVFVFGVWIGEKIGANDAKEAKKPLPNAETAKPEAVKTEEEQKRRFEEDQLAFLQCMNYCMEKAYGKEEK